MVEEKDYTPGRESLEYEPSKVSWATAEFISRPPSPAPRVFLYVLITALVAAFFYTYYAEVPVAIKAKGKLVSQQSPVTVRAPIALTVGSLQVEDQEQVDKGDVLLKPRTTLSDEDFQRVEADYEKLQEFLKRDEAGDCDDECTEELKRFAEEAFTVSGTAKQAKAVNKTLSPIQNLLRKYVVAKVDFENIGLETQGLRQKIRVSRDRLEKLRESDASGMLGKEIEDLETRIANAKSQISKIRGRTRSKVESARAKLKVQLGGLLAQLKKYRSETSIVAPRAGTVANLKVGGEGELIGAGKKILDILPEDSELVGKMMVANRDIDDVQEGLDVKISLAALPEREFGAVWGKVARVPVAPASAGKRPSRRRKKGAAKYPVTVKLEKQALEKGGKEYPFRLGMQFEGVVITEYESLLERGIRKLLKIKDEVFEF